MVEQIADNDGNDEKDTLPASAEGTQVRFSHERPMSADPDDFGLLPSPLKPFMPSSDSVPSDQPQQEAVDPTSPHEDESSDSSDFWAPPTGADDQSDDSGPPIYSPNDENNEPEDVERDRGMGDDPNDSETLPLCRDEVMEEILEYLKQSMFEKVYGECLSGSRTQRYEPTWPMDFRSFKEPPLIQPRGQDEAHLIFRQLVEPFRAWYGPWEGPNPMEADHRRMQIAATLREYRQNRSVKAQPTKCSGNFLLYRNLPDAAIEANVWSLCNAANIAIRRKAWDKAGQYVNRGIILANKLNFKALVAKCWYWRGRVAEGSEDRVSAVECFMEAMPCVDVYQEGDLLAKVVPKYKHDLIQLLNKQEAEQGETEWTLEVRRGLLGHNGWFQPLKHVPKPRSYSSSSSEVSPTDDSPEDDSDGDGSGDDSPRGDNPGGDNPGGDGLGEDDLWEDDPDGDDPGGDISQRDHPGGDDSGRRNSTDDDSDGYDSLQDIPQEGIQLKANSQQNSLLRDNAQRHIPHNDSSPPELSPESQPSSQEQQIAELLHHFQRNGDSGLSSDSFLQPRKLDWALVEKLEEAAKKDGHVPKDMIYEISKGLSSVLESVIRAEHFTENFDNYPNLETSIAWKVLQYVRWKAQLEKPSETKRIPQEVDLETANRLIKPSEQPPHDGAGGSSSVGVQALSSKRSGGVSKGPSLAIDTGNSGILALTCQTPTDVVRQMRRVDITADEKIAAYEQAVLNRQDDNEGKSARRLELENDREWLDAIKTQQANFDEHVRQEMATSKKGPLNARVSVTYKNKESLKEAWGPEGVEPPTPSPTRREREKNRNEKNEQAVKLFKAQLTCLTYRRKYNAYLMLPIERREHTTEPVRPSSTIEWLEEEKLRRKQKRDKLLDSIPDRRVQVSSTQLPDIEEDSDPVEMDVESDPQDHPSLMSPPLNLHHQPPLQIPPPRSDPTRPQTNSKASTLSSLGTLPSNASSNTYASYHRRLDIRIAREIEILTGMDAMSEAMEQARLNDEDVSTEQLLQIAETAISEIGSAPGSGDSDGAERDSPESGDDGDAEGFGAALRALERLGETEVASGKEGVVDAADGSTTIPFSPPAADVRSGTLGSIDGPDAHGDSSADSPTLENPRATVEAVPRVQNSDSQSSDSDTLGNFSDDPARNPDRSAISMHRNLSLLGSGATGLGVDPFGGMEQEDLIQLSDTSEGLESDGGGDGGADDEWEDEDDDEDDEVE